MSEREIKLRAWDGEEIYIPAMLGSYPEGLKEIERSLTRSWLKDDVVLMQYTGLKDKNGVEVYDGDIVRYIRTNWMCVNHPDNETDLTTICEIYWSSEAHGFKQKGSFTSGGGWSGSLAFDDGRADENIIEVIGNIYENPELLEANDE